MDTEDSIICLWSSGPILVFVSIIISMSDWGQVRYQKKKQVKREDDVQFRYKEEEEEEEEEEQAQEVAPKSRPEAEAKDKQATNTEEEQKMVVL